MNLRALNLILGFLLVGFLSLPWTLHGDTITLHDGSTHTGQIISEQNGVIQFRDPQYGILQFNPAQVASVQRSNNASPGGASQETLIAQARAEVNRGDHAAAMSSLTRAAEISVTPELVQQYHTTFQQLQALGDQQMASTPDSARTNYKALYDALSNPVSQSVFAQGNTGVTYQQAAQNAIQKLAQANVRLADRMSNNMAMRQQVQNLYAEAVALTQQQNLDYLIGFGNAARNNSDLDTAFAAYNAVLNSGRATTEQEKGAYDGLARVNTASNGRLVRTASATPTPAFAPPPAVAATPYMQQQNTMPAAAPAAAQPDIPIWQQWWNSIKDGSIFSNIMGYAEDYIGMSGLIILGVIVGAFILLWIIPYQVLKFLAKCGDSDAGDRLWKARKLGFITFIGYIFARISRARSTRHRCPFCNKGIDNLEDYKDLNFIVCPHCREPITPIYDMKDYIDHLIAQLKISQRTKGQRGDALIEKDAMLKLVRGVLSYAIRRRSSDFHLESANEGGKIRTRVDGIMYDLLTLPREISPAFISALKVMANLDITERRVPQDGKIALWMDNEDYDLRINTSPASMGEKVVIRILRQDSINISPNKLGFDGNNLAIYERNINKPHGVVIVTGPSGSGKSTTLYVALNELNSGDKNIVTIEDPIEYQLKGLSQMQVNPAANFNFANGLRSILRQDPDVIMVGEIRDKETAEAALDAAMTGHLVLTTLHTIDAPSAFSRMKDLGIEPSRVASAVNLVIAQRLVRTICSDCRKTYKPKAADLETLGLTADNDIQFVHGTGCETCMNTGYYGRLALFEMLEINEDLRASLETNVATTAIRELARKNGLRTLREEGIRKVKEGVTTIEEVVRVTT